MGPKPSQPQSGELFRPRLDEQLNMKHPLVRLATLIDWAEIERTLAVSFTSGRVRPAFPVRLVAGLLCLQNTFNASDEAVVNTWVENPYWQFFCGETYLQTELPIDPSSLTRWRKRIGEKGVETLLAASIDAAHRGEVIKRASVQQVIVDTTVMPKASPIPPTAGCWTRAASTWSRRPRTTACGCARTTTGWHRGWTHRSGATRTPSSSSA